MFYESDRIVRKQARYIYTRAQDMIQNFRSTELEDEEIRASLELLLQDENNSEIYQDIVKKALLIMNKEEV